MLKITAIKESNSRFAAEDHAGLVCVFSGATSGIGAGTLQRMITMLHSSTFYVLGRSSTRFAVQRKKLESLSASNKIIFLEGDVSLISDIDAACKQIAAAEKRVDYLYMSQGIFPLNSPEYTKEGLEMCFTLSYYSKIRLMSNLLPLLHKSQQPRILCVLNAGNEKSLCEEDLGLQHNWSTFAVINQAVTMMTLSLEHLSKNEEQITFLHAAPGLVRTNIFTRLEAPEGSGIIWRFTVALVKGLTSALMQFFGISVEESGERHSYHLTSENYGPGLSLVGPSSDKIPTPAVITKYIEGGWPGKIWEFTEGVFDRVLVG